MQKLTTSFEVLLRIFLGMYLGDGDDHVLFFCFFLFIYECFCPLVLPLHCKECMRMGASISGIEGGRPFVGESGRFGSLFSALMLI